MTPDPARIVTFTVFDPMSVAPEYVSQVITHTPDVADGIWFSSDNGTDHEWDVATPVAIVPVAPRKEYFSVCVNDPDARGVLIVTDEPASTDPADTVGVVALGIVGSVTERDAVPFPTDP
jgi:hypothetical protein